MGRAECDLGRRWDGRRVKVTMTEGGTTWTVSIFAGMDTIYEKDSSDTVTMYVHANGLRIAKITPTGAVQYCLGDALGSTRTLIGQDKSASSAHTTPPSASS